MCDYIDFTILRVQWNNFSDTLKVGRGENSLVGEYEIEITKLHSESFMLIIEYN